MIFDLNSTPKFLKRKILVTGANGFLGRGVVKALLDDGNIVIATDLRCDNVDLRAIKKPCDIFTLDDPFSFFEKPDVLLHLAWRNGFVHDDKTHIDDLSKHVAFINKVIDSGIKKVTVIGTMHEIGFFEGCIDNDTPCNPLSFYGVSKNALRQTLDIVCKRSNVKFQWLRCYYIVSNDAIGNSIFSKLIRANNEGLKMFPFSDGTNKYDFVDYDECCLKICSATEQDEVLGIINICSGNPQSLSDRVEKFISDNELQIKLDYGKYPTREYDSKITWGNSSKIDYIMNCKKK